jgi:hypothetical protein
VYPNVIIISGRNSRSQEANQAHFLLNYVLDLLLFKAEFLWDNVDRILPHRRNAYAKKDFKFYGGYAGGFVGYGCGGVCANG